MSGYKSAAMRDRGIHRSIVGGLTYLALIEYQQNWGADLITTVPSLSGRQGKHPLLTIAEAAAAKLTAHQLVKPVLQAAVDVHNPRSLNPANFVVDGAINGQQILLIEDTWTTGGHVLSAAEALRLAGASVDIFVVARWLSVGGSFDGTELYEQAGRSHTDFKSVRFFNEL